MVNKKGWIRILEASISILIIFGVLLFVFQNKSPQQPQDLSNMISPLLEEIASNTVLRNEIVSATPEEFIAVQNDLNGFLSNRIKNPSLNYTAILCPLSDNVCSLPVYPSDAGGEIYAKDRIISSSLNAINPTPKRVKIYIWVRQ